MAKRLKLFTSGFLQNLPEYLFKSSKRLISSKEVFEREARYGCHNYKPLPVALTKGKGS